MLKTRFSRFLISCSALLFLQSTSAFAMPAVGDSVTYSVTTVSGSQTTAATEVVSVVAFNASKSEYELQTTLTPQCGQPTSTESWQSEDSFASTFWLSQVETRCQQSGGQVQTVATPAGSFSSCAVPTQGSRGQGTAWIGHVPFGLLKSQAEGAGTTVTKIITHYQFAQ